ncbi:MAG: MFS transporter [Clostridia bacterium]|nr:MFS transporter [Clostridia bacterium]
MKKNNIELKNAFRIGFVCVFTYLACYYLRNVLGVFTPQMLETGLFDKQGVALLSSVYMISYAAGQLVNGTLGDYIKPKYMVFIGLMLSGTATTVFGFSQATAVGIACFVALGIGLSMLRGPLTKVISENTLPQYARVICVALSFMSFFGSFVAGLFALWMRWNTAFFVSGAISYAMAVFGFVFLTALEKRGVIKQASHTKGEKVKIDILGVFRIEKFPIFLLIGMVIEISATSINFWIPTYISEYLGFESNVSGVLFSVISFAKAFCLLFCIPVFKLFKENDVKLVRVMFIVATALYGVMFFVRNAWLNIIIFIIALMATSFATSTLWSIYIPSLGKTGKVSSANGVMDSTGYVAAAISNVLFATIMDNFGWSGIIITWGCVMLFGVIATLFAGARKKSSDKPESEEKPEISE